MNPTLLQPQGPDDPFCTCPCCYGLGHHGVEILVWERRTLPCEDGETVDVSTWGDPPVGHRYAHRTCTFCGHTWRTSGRR